MKVHVDLHSLHVLVDPRTNTATSIEISHFVEFHKGYETNCQKPENSVI